jgi:O-antigen/teichoic acid export membrane protein
MKRTAALTIGRNIIWLLLGQIVSLGIILITIPLFLRVLGAESFGAFTTATSVMGFLGIFQIGAGSALRKFVSDSYANGDTETINRLIASGLAWTCCVGVLIITFLMVGSEPFLMPLLHPSKGLHKAMLWCLWLSGYGLVFDMIGGVFATIPFAAQRMEASALPDMVINVLSRLSALFALSFGIGLVGLIALFVCWQALRLVWRAYIARKFLYSVPLFPRFYLGETKKVLRFGSWRVISDIFGSIAFRLDTVLIARYWSLQEVPIYSIPMTICLGVSSFLGLVNDSVFPEICARINENIIGKLKDLYLRHVRMVSSTFVPAYLFIAFASPLLLRLWLGKQGDVRMSLVLSIIAGSQSIQLLTGLHFTYVLAANKPEYIAWEALGLTPLYLILFLLLIPSLGALGPAVTYCILTILIVIPINVYLFCKNIIGVKTVNGGLIIWIRALIISLITLGISMTFYRTHHNIIINSVFIILALSFYSFISFKCGLWSWPDLEVLHCTIRSFISHSLCKSESFNG